MNIKKIVKRNKIVLILVFLLGCVYYFCLPKKLFPISTSTVVTANNNELLGAIIADDGQWRFPEVDSVPEKFQHCILQFEDGYFYHHFGFNPVSIGKAFLENIKAGKVKRGGSTLTQQVIRLSRKNSKRTYFEKIIELTLATRLEFRYSKKKILELYASHAPFGSNVVGLEMAAWRYYGLHPYQLSWAETATLAVLPNAPSLIYPGKNQERLKKKRDRLLKKLYEKGIIDATTYELALAEELPKKPYKLPQIASHFVQEIGKKHKGKRIQSSIDIHLQKQVNFLAKQYYQIQRQNEVYNLSVLILDVSTRKVLAYVGNAPTDKKHQKHVNNIIAPRSTGSVLKPLLFAQMLYSGDLLPKELLADVPTEIAGYVPKNFSLTYDGAVPADQALTRSLNIPAVRMLRKYGLHKFRDDLKDYKIKHITRPADYYGLSLILGGAEASLWDLCKVYAGYAGMVNHYEELEHQYYDNEFVEPSCIEQEKLSFGSKQKFSSNLDVGSVFTTLNILTEVNRPSSEQAWKYYESSQKIAWKTGTSFGNKDAWAIGVTPKYVVGVWVGNSDGEGRPELTGASAASPLLFNVFNVLPKSEWFLEPFEDLIEESICTQSGCLALPHCPSVKKRIPKNGVKGRTCPYHYLVQLDKRQQFRVNSDCESISNIVTKQWFVLPPLMAYYYKQKNASYKELPSFKSGCNQLEKSIEFLYPTQFSSKISLTKNTEGKINPLILMAAHANPNATIYWYLDNTYLTKTNDYHEIAVTPSKGKHTITVVDDYGNEQKRILEIQ